MVFISNESITATLDFLPVSDEPDESVTWYKLRAEVKPILE